jgi:hypothetical protein
MLETISIVGISLGYESLYPYAYGNSAVSSEARAVRNAVNTVVESTERSQVLFGEKSRAISQIVSLAKECAEPGWDGDEAAPLNRVAVNTAERFIRALPNGVPLPEFAPEPDGAISLDWIRSRSRLFSLSVGSTNRLAYARLDGSDREHGVAQFDGEQIPSRVIEGILGIMSHGRATLGT